MRLVNRSYTPVKVEVSEGLGGGSRHCMFTDVIQIRGRRCRSSTHQRRLGYFRREVVWALTRSEAGGRQGYAQLQVVQNSL